MAQNLARAVTRLVSTSPFMINILVGVQEYSLSVPPTVAFVWRRGSGEWGKRYLQPKKNPPKTASYMCDILIASVVIRLLSARCIKSSRNDTKLTAVGVSSRRRVPTRSSNARRFVLLIGDGCSLLCFILQKGAFSVSPLPLAFVAQNVLSAPHITGEPPKNCAPARCKNTYIPCWAPFNPPRQREKKNDKKGGG